ncbi:MAG: rhodanese-related sulfurtransferase [Halocynthiibacter sp.]|jgi:rhodanese-related sulfurtransferase
MLNFINPRAGAGVMHMDAQKAISEAAKGLIVLIDVRDGNEVKASGKAAGALHLPLASFQMRANPSSPECEPALKSGKPLVLYCASGARSNAAGQMLLKMGYEDVRNLGGLRDWAVAGGAIER